VKRAERSREPGSRVFFVWLVFRVSATRSARTEEEGERAHSPPSRPFSSRLVPAFPACTRFFLPERIMRSGPYGEDRGTPLLRPPLTLLATLLSPSLFPTGTSTERPSIPARDPPKRRQLLQKTGAARHIIILLYCHHRLLLLRHFLTCSTHPDPG